MNSDERFMVEALINELEYVRSTGDIRDSLRNHPTLTEDARKLFNLPNNEESTR